MMMKSVLYLLYIKFQKKSAGNCKECEYKKNKQTVARVVSFVGKYVEKAQKVGCFPIFSNACSPYIFMLFQKKIIFCVVQGL